MRCFLIYIPCQVQILLSNIWILLISLFVGNTNLCCVEMLWVFCWADERLSDSVFCVCEYVEENLSWVCYIFSSAGQLWFISFNYLHFTLWRFDFTAFQILEICIDLHGTAWNYSWFTTQLFQAHRLPQRFSSDLSFKKMTPLWHLQYFCCGIVEVHQFCISQNLTF